MKKRQLGKTNIQISEVGLGTWQMSGDVWGKKTEAEYIQAIKVAMEAGIKYFDTYTFTITFFFHPLGKKKN